MFLYISSHKGIENLYCQYIVTIYEDTVEHYAQYEYTYMSYKWTIPGIDTKRNKII